MDMPEDHTLAFLLDFDGRIHDLEQGYWLKFEIKRVDETPVRPHGLSYSFTLHGPDGNRLLGFDNAHPVPAMGRSAKRPIASDHWHRTVNDKGQPYRFVDADTLLADFFAEVRRVLAEHGVSETVVGTRDNEQRSQT